MKDFTLKDIAEYTIYYTFSNSYCITNIALQKILYFLHYLFLYNKNQKLTHDAKFEAWSYGPVNPQIYYDYYYYGGFIIIPTDKPQNYDEVDQYIGEFREYLKKWSKITTWDLIMISHTKGDAWDLTYKKDQHQLIPDQLIKSKISHITKEKLEIE